MIADQRANQRDTPPRPLHQSGIFWAGIASACIVAALALAAILSAPAGGGFDPYCNDTTANGILHDVPPELSSRYDSLKVVQGKHRSFPPSTQCLVYGGKYSHPRSDHTDVKYKLIAEHYHPGVTPYLWMMLFAISPFVVLFLTRLTKRILHRSHPATTGG